MQKGDHRPGSRMALLGMFTRIEGAIVSTSRGRGVCADVCRHNELSAKLARTQEGVQREACLQQHADWVAPTDGVAVLL